MYNPNIISLPPIANTLRDLDMRFTWVTHVWLAVNQNTSITFGERFRCSKRIARASELLAAVNQNYLIHEVMNVCKKSKDSFKDRFENVNILIKSKKKKKKKK